MTPLRVGVVGGGIVGLSVAWEATRHGHDVTVYDPDPGGGASHVAAGMLAPVSEAYFGEQRLTEFLLESARRWPGFAASLSAALSPAATDLGYRDEGTLQVGLTADDLADLTRLWRHSSSLGLALTALDAAELREREPALHPRARGVFVPGDHQVDPRRVVAALRSQLDLKPTAIKDLSEVDAQVVVLAAGLGSAALARLPLRSVQGVLLRLRGPRLLRHVIRGYADGRSVYLAPRGDGEVLVGATVEERCDGLATAGAVRDLLRAAIDLVPDLAEHAVVETSVGQRPATPDNGPILGELVEQSRPDRRVLVATGHYRHGVLAAPLTATAIAALIDGEPMPDVCRPFTPRRFPDEPERSL